MAAPNTNTSDLDHANATITALVSHLDNFKVSCETPSEDPDIFQRLQQLRIHAIHGDLDKIREDLNSVRQRLESTAESAAASNEEDAAKRKEKQANLDMTIQAAGEREREAKKSEECLSAAIKFANDKATEAQEAIQLANHRMTEAQEVKAKAREKKSKAREKKAGAEEKHKAAEKMMEEAQAKQGEAEKHQAEAEEKNKAAEKMMQDADAKEDEAEKEISDAQHLKLALSQREKDVSRREQDMTRREQDVSRREQALETAKQASQAEALKHEKALDEAFTVIQKRRDALKERCRLAEDHIKNASSIQAEVKKDMAQTMENKARMRGAMVKLEGYNEKLDNKLKEAKRLLTQVSTGLDRFQRVVADHKQWVSADDNPAKKTVDSLKKAMTDVSNALLDDAANLSSATTNVSHQLAGVSNDMEQLKVASEGATTLAEDLVRLQEATTDLVDDLGSSGKRRLSSPVEPSGKRAKSSDPTVLRGGQADIVEPLGSMGSQADIDPTGHVDEDPIDTASSSRVIKSPRPRRSTSATPGPSGPSNQFLLLSDSPAIYGLRPGFGLCPDDFRAAEDDTQRTWAQISFGDQWTMDDSNALLEDFNKYAAKGVTGQMPQVCLDRCAEAPIGEDKCLHRDLMKKGSTWNKDQDRTTEECVQCSKNFHFCIRVVHADPSPGLYDKDATDGTRWLITRRR